MSRSFVLDENVVILAQAGKDQFGRADSTCLDLLLAIERNCHNVAVTAGVWTRYARQATARGRPSTSLVALIALLNNSAKENHFLSEGEYPHPPELESLPGVVVGDRDFVRIAAAVLASVLVTTDGPLRSALISNAIDQKYQFVVATPAEALAMAGPTDP